MNDAAAASFESAWRNGETPAIADFLVGDERHPGLAVKLASVDIEYRWRRAAQSSASQSSAAQSSAAQSPAGGEPRATVGRLPASPVLEDYLTHLPQLGPVDALPTEIIAHEFFVRTKWGDRPAVQSYQQRFPKQYEDFCAVVKRHQHEWTVGLPTQHDRDTVTVAGQNAEANTQLHDSDKPGRSPASAQAVELPERFGRYKILKTLGAGGMGAVYLGEDLDLERKVAIKVPFFEPGEGNSVLDRFRREAKSIAALHHPNICPVFEVAEEDGVHYMAMAFIDGKPLSEYVRPGEGQNVRTAAILVRKIALALHDAHQHGVIHRDLKPANIMIDRRKEPIVMDFGLARREGKADTQLTTAGQVMGTPSYMPPEQVAGRVEEMGPGCDIYSLGVILYELLAGRLPFQGDMLAVLSQIAMDTPVPPSTHRAEIDDELDAICLKAMEKKAADRYGSMADFARALGDYVKRLAIQESSLKSKPKHEVDRPKDAALVTADGAASPNPTESGELAVPVEVSGKPRLAWMVAVVGGLAALCLLAAVIFYVRTGDGTIRVEINDPAIEVAIQGTDITLKQADQGKDVKLSPGERTLVVQREDFKFETDKLILKRGERITVQVELLAGEVRVRQGEQVIGRKQLPPATARKLVGAWREFLVATNQPRGITVEIRSDLAFRQTQPGKPLKSGTVQLNGDRLTLTHVSPAIVEQYLVTLQADRVDFRELNGGPAGFFWRRTTHKPSTGKPSSAAQSGFPEGYFYMTTRFAERQGLVLESAPLTLKKRGDFTGMAWRAVPAGDGCFYLTSQFFEDRDQVLEGSDGESAAVMMPHTGVIGTLWKTVPAGNGYYYLTTRFMEKKGYVLDGNVGEARARFKGAPYMVAKKEAGPGAQWKFLAERDDSTRERETGGQ